MKTTSDMKLLLLENQNLKAVLSAVTHEMKNSLTLVLGNSRLLEQEIPSVASSRCWKEIQADLLHIKDFLQDLSSFRPPEEIRLDRRPCDLGDLLQETCRHCQIWFDGRRRKLILSVPDTPLLIYGDRNRLYQILLNLIKNGAEALDREGTVSLLLRKGTEKEKLAPDTQTAIIQIKDTGGGLSHPQIQEALHPFYTTKPDGTGLGLPIAQSLTKAHGGRLQISSRLGKGTTVTLFLPLLPSSAP